MGIDDDKRALERASEYARQLQPVSTVDDEQIVNRIANQFFGEGGIPPGLKDGWSALEKRRKVRKSVGYPLPPGGCFALGYDATVAGLLAELHTLMAASLKMDAQHIKLFLKKGIDGSMYPDVKIDPPKNWVLPVTLDIKDPSQAERHYLRAITVEAQIWWCKRIEGRLAACSCFRKDVLQPVIPWGKHGERQGSKN